MRISRIVTTGLSLWVVVNFFSRRETFSIEKIDDS